MSQCSYYKITNKKLLCDLKEIYMYDTIEVHVSPTSDFPPNGNNVVYKTSDHIIDRQMEIISKFLKASNFTFLKNTLYVSVVMSGYSEGNICDTYIFFVKLDINAESIARKMRIRAQMGRF